MFVKIFGTVVSLEVLAMGGTAVGDDLRESAVVVVVERQEGVIKLEFGCDITGTFLEGEISHGA